MVQMEGKYSHEKNENLDGYFKEVGVPYIPRKMICSSSPTLEISKNGDEWQISVMNLFSNVVSKFVLGEEYDEEMPGGLFKNITVIEGNKLITKSSGPENASVSRIYEFSEGGCVIEYKHEKSGIVAKRYFKRM